MAEVARRHGIFVWLSGLALTIARGSQSRLFATIYLVGVAVTALLSNDTTVIVLTPAAIAILARTNARPLPYLYGCAFVANAASYVLPTSNPANLIVFAAGLPSLRPWVDAFAISAAVAIVATFGLLVSIFRVSLRARFSETGDAPSLSRAGVVALVAIGVSAAALVIANAAGWPVGIVAFVSALASIAIVAVADRGTPAFVARCLQWEVIPLVAGLFVVVAALERAGAIESARSALDAAARLPDWAASVGIGSVTAVACNLFNNLPVALFAGAAVRDASISAHVANVALVAIDLGPNLSVTGSLATLLWLIVLRREGIEVTGWQFLRLGAVVMFPALVLAVLTVR